MFTHLLLSANSFSLRKDFPSAFQAVMASSHLPGTGTGRELIFVPASAATISAFILLLHSVLALKSVNGLFARVGILEERRQKLRPPGIGKGLILWFRVARLLGCLALLALSIFPFVSENGDALHEELGQGLLLIAPYVSCHAHIGANLT
jgi:hypothetical protein